MTVHADSSGPLHVRTVAIDNPGDLIAAMPSPGISWVRRGEGMVAWGEAARFDTHGPDRIDAAQAWWRLVSRHATVRDDVALQGTGLVAFGSFAFADSSPAGGALIVPRFILGRRGGRAWLTVITREGEPRVTADDALAGASSPVAQGEVTVAPGDREAWSAAVEEAVDAIRAGRLDKVVLARAVAARAAAPIDARTLLTRLAAEYPTCWAFHVDGLVGATPELLARVDHGLVTSRVLAGTIRMTGDDAADLARAGALARSSKDREEHEYAVRSVGSALAEHCASINVPDEPFVLHLPNVMHLATDVTGVLSHNVSSLEIVRELHPSAAVCGTPTLAAARAIDQLEGLDRGRYAGPVGWTSATGDGEWCIALRSAEISAEDPRALRMFAGCGIVAASEPDSEWAESEAKLEPMRRALGVDERAAATPAPETAPVPVVIPPMPPAPALPVASVVAAPARPAPVESASATLAPLTPAPVIATVDEDPDPDTESIPLPAMPEGVEHAFGPNVGAPGAHTHGTPEGPQGWDTAAWEERYRSRDALWSAEPNAQLVEEAATIAVGRALDAGCGEGADAVYLASLGWHVTAIDISPTAIDRGRERATRAGGDVADRIEWRVDDAMEVDPIGAGFQLVTTHFAHPEAGISTLVRHLSRLVAPGGTLLVVGHHPRDPHTEGHPRLSQTAFRAEDAALGLDPEVWDVEAADMRERSMRTVDGDVRTRRDAVLRARRRG